jgi:hypothetical protein
MASTSKSVIASSKAIVPASKLAIASSQVILPAFSAYVEAHAAAEKRQKQGETVNPTHEGMNAGSKASLQNLPSFANYIAESFA